MKIKGKACTDGVKTDVLVPLHMYLYSSTLISIVILSQGFQYFVVNAQTQQQQQQGDVGNSNPHIFIPPVFSVTSNSAIYVSNGTKQIDEDTILAFGPGFEKIMEKHNQIYPNLDSNLLNDGELERKKQNLDRMIHMTVPELIENGGKQYRWKAHNVLTEDHYILTIFQIRKRRECNLTVPILFMHDFLGSAADWLLVDPEDAIPFAMVDQGFEVWLLNARGNEYSNRHQFYKTADPRFWNFSFHEQGIYDIPAVIKHVKQHTQTQSTILSKNRRVTFVGSGMGTTIFYVYVSKNGTTANRNIFSFVSQAPTAFLSKTTSPLKLLAPLAFDYLPFQKDGPLIPELLANFLHYALPELCPSKMLKNVSLCVSGGFLPSAASSQDISTRVMRRVFGHYPGTTSIRTFLHYVQLSTKPKFKEFDFGAVKNFKRYKQLVPLQYNLFQASVAVSNIFTQRDINVDFRDAERTADEVSVTLFQINFMITGAYTNIDLTFGTIGTYIMRYSLLAHLRVRAVNSCYFQLANILGQRPEDVPDDINNVINTCCLLATSPLKDIGEVINTCCFYSTSLFKEVKRLVEVCCIIATSPVKELFQGVCPSAMVPAESEATQCDMAGYCGCKRQTNPFLTKQFTS